MLLAVLCVTGLAVGLLVGLTGVGGILIPPALILLSGLEPHEAMGTALASFLPLGLAGTFMYRRLGHVDWSQAVPYMLGGLAALPGAMINARINASPLVVLLASIILFAGVCVLRPPRAGGSTFWQGRAGFFFIGAATAFLAGMTGAGGPVLSIPWMIAAGVSPMTAVGLAMPYQVVTALFGTVGNIQGGHVDFELLPALCVFETAGFALGVALARRTPTATLRTLIGGICCLLGLLLLVRELSAPF
ncbi:sulfite exporter TauE/SafE family protein [Desulfovibrio sp.]|uniref:sulfite exporter TauE/SafE family protein n=1 Tax=Desulfovibrio sp. TaxID=885 RepID=UPI0035B3CB6B